jgi:ABC-type transporter Mla MlaB component
MKLQIIQEKSLLRFVIDNSDGWDADNFFSELDRVFLAIKEVAEKDEKDVLFDLCHAKRVDSSMITLLVQTMRVIGGRKMSIITCDSDTADLISLMGLDKLAHIYDSEDAWREGKEYSS